MACFGGNRRTANNEVELAVCPELLSDVSPVSHHYKSTRKAPPRSLCPRGEQPAVRGSPSPRGGACGPGPGTALPHTLQRGHTPGTGQKWKKPEAPACSCFIEEEPVTDFEWNFTFYKCIIQHSKWMVYFAFLPPTAPNTKVKCGTRKGHF